MKECLRSLYAGLMTAHSFTSMLLSLLDAAFFNELKLNPEKCVFVKHGVVYLDHLITQYRITTDPSKHGVFQKCPISERTDVVQHFMAFYKYYKDFIKTFAEIATCPNNL